MFGELVDERMAWSATALDAEFREIELAMRELDARRAANLAAGEARRAADLDGHRSTQAYVRATTHAPRAAASRLVRRCRFLRDHPSVGDALISGHIGVPQVDLLARVANHRRVGALFDDSVIALMVEFAEHFAYDDFERLVERWVTLADQDGAWFDQRAAVEAREATVRVVGNELDVRAAGGDVLTAERMQNIMNRFVDAELQHDLDARRAAHGDQAEAYPLPRTNAQRRFDALVAIFDTANAHAEAPGKPVDVAANVLIDSRTVHAAFESEGVLLPSGDVFDPGDLSRDECQQLLDELVADPSEALRRRCETVSGHPVHPRLVARALLTGYVRRVVVDSAGVPISFGRLRRCFTGPAAVVARLQTARCEFPGCGLLASECEVDHMRPASAGGHTDQANAATLCGPHNRFKHRRRWRARRGTHRRLSFTRPDGTLVLAVGERPPDPTDEQEEAATRARIDALIALRQAS